MLYIVDHQGANPQGNALDPYVALFEYVQAGCGMSDETLANRILELATQASNGSSARVTNLGALRAVARRVRPNQEDCPSIFAQTEALLGGAAVG
jgi:hypothetical protein